MFHHFVPAVWMNYANRPRHWDDHQDWWVYAKNSSSRFSEMIRGEPGPLGLGRSRTMEEYQRYSGIDYFGRRVHKDIFSGKEPPMEYTDQASWDKAMSKDYSITVTWNTDDIERCDDYDYWYFAVEDEAGNNIVRQDLRHERDAPVLDFKTNNRRVIMKSFEGRVPHALCIWPVSKSKGWLKKSKFPLDSSV
jgi:hypothetical protein